MHDFVAHVLRRYYAQTDWNPYNSYLYLTSSSQAVLDFAIPSGLSLSISASPSPPFFTTYRLRALPQLTGALGYIFASIEDGRGVPLSLDLGGSSRDVNLKDFVERFRIIDTPRQAFQAQQQRHRDDPQQKIAQTALRDRRDYLLYGCMHIPSTRVDALFTTRLAPTWQLLATAISVPPRNAFGLSGAGGSSIGASSAAPHHPGGLSEKASDASLNASAAAMAPSAGPPPGATNLQINLQQDTGRWFTEYSYSVDDGLLGFRVLHNLGHLAAYHTDATHSDATTVHPGDVSPQPHGSAAQRRIDDDTGHETSVGGGLQGRFSVGAELFVSPLEKSAGLSTGMRFTTLPETATPGSGLLGTHLGQMPSAMSGNDVDAGGALPSQTPTTITATLNPMMGHLCTAYAARMARDIVACSRFDFNVFSYESELTIGAEYWLRGNRPLLSSLSRSANQEAEAGKSGQEWAGKTAAKEDWVQAMDRERKLLAKEQTSVSLRDTSVTSGPARPLSWSLRDREDAGPTLSFSNDSAPSSSFAPRSRSSSRRRRDQDSGDEADVLPTSPSSSASARPSDAPAAPAGIAKDTTIGVLKARISTTGIAALMWCGRLRNCLVSIGLRGDISASSLSGSVSGSGSLASMQRGFAGPGKPLRGVGIDVIYFSQNGE